MRPPGIEALGGMRPLGVQGPRAISPCPTLDGPGGICS